MIGQHGHLSCNSFYTKHSSSFMFDYGNGSNKKLFTGALRIAGDEKQNTPETVAEPAKPEASDSKPVTVEQKEEKLNVSDRFTETLLSRLANIQDETGAKKTPEDSQKLVNSITATIEEIRKKFGQEAANRAMADILTGTEKNMTADAIAGAVSGVLKGLSEASEETIKDPSATKEQYEAALKTKEQLQEFVKKLNEANSNEDGSGNSGLNGALSSYFGLSAESQKNFTDDYSWASPIKDGISSEGGSYKAFAMSVKEFGRAPLQEFADYLRSEVGSEEAAKYIEGLSDGEDVFDAVDRVRNILLENTHVTEPDAESIRRFGASFPQRAGEGVEQLGKVNRYLAENMVDAANESIRGSAEIKARLQAATAYDSDRNQSDTYGLYTWPRGVSVGRLCDWRYGESYRTWDFGECGDSSGADRFLKPMEVEVDGKRIPCTYQIPSSTGTLMDKLV